MAGDDTGNAAQKHIRPFRPDDAAALAALFHAAVHGIGGRHYSPAQVSAWAPMVSSADEVLAQANDGRLTLVAVGADDRPLAYGDLEPDGHIDQLYCCPEFAGSGLAARLYYALEAAAVERDIDRLFVEASEPARRFFRRRGFDEIGRRDFILRGVPIHNFAMEKSPGEQAR